MKNLLILFFLICCIFLDAQPNICLQLTPDSVWGRYPNLMASGDMNNDGYTDLIDIPTTQNCVRILLADGTGSFTNTIILQQTFYPNHIQVSKFDMDSNLDFLISSPTKDTVAVLLGTGTGSAIVGNKLKIASIPSALAVSDFNNDNLNDFVVSCPTASLVSIFLGSGASNFSAPVSFTFSSDPENVIVRDFNNDNNQDIFVATSSSNYFLKGGGNGTFTIISGPAQFNSQRPYTFAFINNDNIPDLVSEGTDSIRVKLGGSNFIFGNTSYSYVQGLSQGQNSGVFSVTDLNNDGKNDLAVGTHIYSLSILYGNGVSSFSAQQTYSSPVQFSGVKNILALELTNDQKEDLLVFQADGPTPFGIYGVFLNCNSVEVGTSDILKNRSNLNLFPSPANNYLSLTGHERQDGTYSFAIYDQFARKIKDLELDFHDNDSEIMVDDLPNGIYILKSQDSDTFSQGQKFVIAR